MAKSLPSSLRAFLDKIIDYAGTYPPANLDLKTAFNNYLDYTGNSQYNWILSKFVCAASKLDELDNLVQNKEIELTHEVSLSVLGSSSVHTSEFQDSIEHDISVISGFSNRYKRKIKISAFEVRLPGDLFSIGGDDALFYVIKQSADSIEKITGKALPVFFEAPPDENLISLAGAISRYNGPGNSAGYKLRTGGVEAAAFPASKSISFAIRTCYDYRIPVKFTAGLHHPIRHYNDEVKTKMHGFINVFGAGILNRCLGTTEDMMTEILEDEVVGNFHFSDSSFGWKQYRVLTSRIKEVRGQLLISFGSCSFDEPVDDLKNLNLL